MPKLQWKEINHFGEVASASAVVGGFELRVEPSGTFDTRPIRWCAAVDGRGVQGDFDDIEDAKDAAECHMLGLAELILRKLRKGDE